MKITRTILALLAAGFLGQFAFADNSNQNLAVIPDGHGGSHFLYYQTNNLQGGGGGDSSVAISTASGGAGASGPLVQQPGVLPDDGMTRFVMGTNQHGQAAGANIPVTSHYAPAGQ
jgi:hypothetical protein